MSLGVYVKFLNVISNDTKDKGFNHIVKEMINTAWGLKILMHQKL